MQESGVGEKKVVVAPALRESMGAGIKGGARGVARGVRPRTFHEQNGARASKPRGGD